MPAPGPDFLGIGAQKAGTTWLHANLAQHPRVRFPGGKEVHFWDREYGRGLDWYRALFAGAPAGVLQGDLTPSYAILPPERIAEAAALTPRARLIYVLRHPVARAWSAAKMAVGRAEMELGEASDAWFRDHFHSRGSRARGDYAACLDAWLAHFPRAALLLVRYEDLVRQPESVARAVCAHLGLDAQPLLAPANPWLRQPVFPGEPAELRPELRAFLDELYAEPLQRLRERHGFGWDPA